MTYHVQVTSVKVVYDQEIDSLKTALQESQYISHRIEILNLNFVQSQNCFQSLFNITICVK